MEDRSWSEDGKAVYHDAEKSPLDRQASPDNKMHDIRAAPVGFVEVAGRFVKDPDEGLSEEEKRLAHKKLLQKLDLRLIPWLSLLYLVSFLDRTNIGNAKLYGLLPDTGMATNPTLYNGCLAIFFVSYSLLEPLTNILLKRFRPKWFLTVTMILWGICMTCMGLVHYWSGLYAVRFFLGVAEAGLFPGVNYYLSCWYKRKEFGKRAAIFFSAAALSGSFGGLLAAAIANMDGIGGKPGWAWIFILEGLVTILIGIACWWMVYDFPDHATFLSDDERARVNKRLREDNQSSAESEKFQWKYFWQSVQDWRTYMFAIVYMGCDGALYAFSLFTPTIIHDLGFQSTEANLLSVPPYAIAAVVTIIVGFYADSSGQRGLCNIVMALFGMVGFCMAIGSSQAGVQYAGVYLGALGIYPCISNTVVWTSNNVEGVYKRGVTMGAVIGWGNLQGVVSSFIYRSQDAPQYYLGHGIVLAYLTLFLFGGSIITRTLLVQENKARKSGKRDHWIEGKTKEEIRQMGDKRPDFIYHL